MISDTVKMSFVARSILYYYTSRLHVVYEHIRISAWIATYTTYSQIIWHTFLVNVWTAKRRDIMSCAALRLLRVRVIFHRVRTRFYRRENICSIIALVFFTANTRQQSLSPFSDEISVQLGSSINNFARTPIERGERKKKS